MEEDKPVKRYGRFPSPAGSSYFSILLVCLVCNRDCEQGFPSPAGSSYFSISCFASLAGSSAAVSVPCGVFVFLNCGLMGQALKKFQVSVPYGVFVFLNSVKKCILYSMQSFRPLRGLRISQFHSICDVIPSIEVSVPCGVFVFLNDSDARYILNGMPVSVPCGVFVFLNASTWGSLKTRRSAVSVPCGVFVFLNRNLLTSFTDAAKVSVPCGVFVFLNGAKILK